MARTAPAALDALIDRCLGDPVTAVRETSFVHAALRSQGALAAVARVSGAQSGVLVSPPSVIAPAAPAPSDMRRRRVPFPVRALLRFPCGCGWSGAGQKEHVRARPPFVRTDAPIGANNFMA